MTFSPLLLVLTLGMTLPTGEAEPPRGEGETSPLFASSQSCLACHNGLLTPSGEDVSIGAEWRASMMANAARDPYWQASVRREVLDHPQARAAIENDCAACHMPMSRYQARSEGRMGEVFSHLPATRGGSPWDTLAGDGVSCTVCHQISERGLGAPESFSGGFLIDDTPTAERRIFGPYEVDAGRRTIMRSASDFVPEESSHIQRSELCASCHTLFTHTLGPNGDVLGELPEQVPYLEWRHSAYVNTQSCQSCHMPEIEVEMPISSVLGEPRQGYSRHSFRGGNFFMLRLLARYRDELGVTAPAPDLEKAARRTLQHLKSAAARISFLATRLNKGRLEAEVEVENLAGHKLPTAYPSRRAWIRFAVRDAAGKLVFESGGLQADGSIRGNDNDSDPSRFEPHHLKIESADQVQIYEPILVDSRGEVTTGLLSALRFIKDNRLLPVGFDKGTAAPDIAVQGQASSDPDFRDGQDRIVYSLDVGTIEGPLRVEAELWYQPIGFRWADNLRPHRAAEIERFLSYYDSMSDSSATGLARATAIVSTPGR